MRHFLSVAWLAALCAIAQAETPIKIATWNVANLHHENGEALRGGAEPRDQQDFDVLKAYTAEIGADIFAFQEIGSPAALKRIIDESKYEIFISSLYRPGSEIDPETRNIYTAIAINKDRFPELPSVSTLTSLSIDNVEISRGDAIDRPVRAGMLVEFEHNGKPVKLLNVHLKSSCNNSSLNPVFDKDQSGKLRHSRYDCRTLLAQLMILENWVEQQRHQGISVVILGDFNRQLNRFDDAPNKTEHFWGELNDGEPDMKLLKGPLGKNTTCWVYHDKFFYDEHIDFIVFDDSLAENIDVSEIGKLALPLEGSARYAGKAGQKLSDHCPVVGTIN
ncbi:endonuclease/exonuclease/phosphatase family protein [Roseibium sediminis]|uniref:endonuclease/exonuclease/phosphatase family protein n=1 Tax=Roseibium sediminis TaxID=1775174 RepID=UPI001375DF6C|nr:endonuclease/exonuclease/phosphatase family protein [Roseibium sediminis]